MIMNKRVVNKMQVNNTGITRGQVPLHSWLVPNSSLPEKHARFLCRGWGREEIIREIKGRQTGWSEEWSVLQLVQRSGEELGGDLSIRRSQLITRWQTGGLDCFRWAWKEGQSKAWLEHTLRERQSENSSYAEEDWGTITTWQWQNRN